MRYIDINEVCGNIPLELVTDLGNKHQLLVDGDEQVKQTIMRDGNITWGKVKTFLEAASSRKCWYTESRNPGCPNDVDHFRPKAQKLYDSGDIEYWYWFLAFDPENYRLSCQFANRRNRNPQTGQTGGKGDLFPLLDGQAHATTKDGIAGENPVLLDPCNSDDCDLLEFMPDGRPAIARGHSSDPKACYRVEQSKLLLNLDFPTLNEDRELLYNRIKNLVDRGDSYGTDNTALGDVKRDLRELMEEGSPYSKAAECYARCFRDREWLEQLL